MDMVATLLLDATSRTQFSVPAATLGNCLLSRGRTEAAAVEFTSEPQNARGKG